jgi:hypothetical protein
MAAHVRGDPGPVFVSALEDNMSVTQTLLTKFMQLGGQTALSLLHSDAYLDRQKAQTEVSHDRTFLPIAENRKLNVDSVSLFAGK